MTAPNPAPSFALPSGVVRLTHWGVIAIEGDDAAKFIHGQLTQDFSLLGTDQARLAAFCNAKGRMQASFIGLKREDGKILLLCSKDLLAPTLKRLSMFVMRSKAKLSDASEAYDLWGLAGDATKNIANGAYSIWAKAELDQNSLVALYPAGSTARQILIAPAGAPQPAGPALPLDTWQWGEVASGVVMVTQPVFEAFVPQMLNYESVGGVSFKKGCYPGQEVVARSQFRGTLKRRAYRVHSTGPLAAAQEIYADDDPENVVGQVVQSAAHPAGGYEAVVVLQTSSQAGKLSVAGAELTVLPLPYSLLEDI